MIKTNNLEELFEDLIGQPSATNLLKSALREERFAPAYLFCGPEGVGRKLAAMRFLEGLLNEGKTSPKSRRRLEQLNHPDLHCVEPTYLQQGRLISKSIADSEGLHHRSPPQIRLEQIREVTRFLGKQPVESKLGMVIIQSSESMGEASANALLKTLEEPGKGLLILISSRPERLLPTIRSRCQQIPFIRLNTNSIKEIFIRNNSNQQQGQTIEIDFNNQELLKLASGSPGAFIKNLKQWEQIPKELWPRLKQMNREPIEALSLARDLTDELDVEQQLWLINWLEQYFWDNLFNPNQLKRLEKLRYQLLSYVQPRLAWEVALLDLNLLIKH